MGSTCEQCELSVSRCVTKSVLFADAGNFLQLYLIREVPKPPPSPLNRSATMPASVRHFPFKDDVSKNGVFVPISIVSVHVSVTYAAAMLSLSYYT